LCFFVINIFIKEVGKTAYKNIDLKKHNWRLAFQNSKEILRILKVKIQPKMSASKNF